MADLQEIESFLALPSSYSLIDDWADIAYELQTADAFHAQSSAASIFTRDAFRQIYSGTPLEDKLDVHAWLNRRDSLGVHRVERGELESLEKRFNRSGVEMEIFARGVFGLVPELVEQILAEVGRTNRSVRTGRGSKRKERKLAAVELRGSDEGGGQGDASDESFNTEVNTVTHRCAPEPGSHNEQVNRERISETANGNPKVSDDNTGVSRSSHDNDGAVSTGFKRGRKKKRKSAGINVHSFVEPNDLGFISASARGTDVTTIMHVKTEWSMKTVGKSEAQETHPLNQSPSMPEGECEEHTEPTDTKRNGKRRRTSNHNEPSVDKSLNPGAASSGDGLETRRPKKRRRRATKFEQDLDLTSTLAQLAKDENMSLIAGRGHDAPHSKKHRKSKRNKISGVAEIEEKKTRTVALLLVDNVGSIDEQATIHDAPPDGNQRRSKSGTSSLTPQEDDTSNQPAWKAGDHKRKHKSRNLANCDMAQERKFFEDPTDNVVNDETGHKITVCSTSDDSVGLKHPPLSTADTVDSIQDSNEYSHLEHLTRQLSPELRRPDMVWGLKYSSKSPEKDPRLTDEENQRIWSVFCLYGRVMRPRHETILLKRRSEELSLSEFVREIEDGTLAQYLKLYKQKISAKDYEGGAAHLVKVDHASCEAGRASTKEGLVESVFLPIGSLEAQRLAPEITALHGHENVLAALVEDPIDLINVPSIHAHGNKDSDNKLHEESTADTFHTSPISKRTSCAMKNNEDAILKPDQHSALLDGLEASRGSQLQHYVDVIDETTLSGSAAEISVINGGSRVVVDLDASFLPTSLSILTKAEEPIDPMRTPLVTLSIVKTSPYFESRSGASPVRKKRMPAGTFSSIPFPPITSDSFGLIQEKLADDPFKLLVAVTFLNKTRGTVAIPTFYKLIEKYPTPEALSQAQTEDVVALIRHLGFQNLRAAKLINLAKTWLETPPMKGVRYRTLNYPHKGAGRGIKPNFPIPDDDARLGAWEIAHMPGCGDYAIDSWRMFCRDKLRGVADGWDDGDGDGDPDCQPEWTRVVPNDKELRAFLRWRWLKEGFEWDPWTGRMCAASPELLKQAMLGNESWQEQQAVVQGRKKVVVAKEFVADPEEETEDEEIHLERKTKPRIPLTTSRLRDTVTTIPADNTRRRSARITGPTAVAVEA